MICTSGPRDQLPDRFIGRTSSRPLAHGSLLPGDSASRTIAGFLFPDQLTSRTILLAPTPAFRTVFPPLGPVAALSTRGPFRARVVTRSRTTLTARCLPISTSVGRGVLFIPVPVPVLQRIPVRVVFSRIHLFIFFVCDFGRRVLGNIVVFKAVIQAIDTGSRRTRRTPGAVRLRSRAGLNPHGSGLFLFVVFFKDDIQLVVLVIQILVIQILLVFASRLRASL